MPCLVRCHGGVPKHRLGNGIMVTYFLTFLTTFLTAFLGDFLTTFLTALAIVLEWGVDYVGFIKNTEKTSFCRCSWPQLWAR